MRANLARRKIADQWLSSSESASVSVYWYCVLDRRAPIGDVLGRLHVERDALDLGELRFAAA